MRTIGFVALVTLLLCACDGGGGDQDAGRDAGSGSDDACATCVPDGGGIDTGVAGDGNDTFAEADALTLGTAVSGVINPPGDLDYYRFEGTAGQWILIDTQANTDDDPTMVDTVVTLFDASMRRIAENDDGYPRANPDSELIVRLPATGTYYVLVQEWSTWSDEAAEGSPAYTYELLVDELSDDLAAVTIDAETGDDPASAQAVSGGAFNVIAGLLEDATDVDVYSIRFPPGGPYDFSVFLVPTGDTGNGSTVVPARLSVANADGTQILARIDPGEIVELSPSLRSGEHLLLVEHGGTAGANDFYVIKAFRGADNPRELMEATNDVPATPEVLTFSGNPNAPEGFTRRSAFILAALGDGDVDHFGIDVAASEQVRVVCGSRSAGSGVIDLEITLLDATGTTTVASATETATEAALIDAVTVPSAGRYLVRLTKASQDSVVMGDFVRCGFHLDAPAP